MAADANAAVHILLQQQHSWVVVDEQTQTTYLKWRAVAFILRQNPLTYALGFLTDIKLVEGAFAALYDWIGRQRQGLGVFTHLLLPFDDRPVSQPLGITKLLCAVLIIIALACNIAVLPPYANVASLEFVRDSAKAVQVFQRWNLFAPSVAQWKYDYVLKGETRAAQVNVMPFFEERYAGRGEDGRLAFTTTRWAKYFLHLFDKNKIEIADAFLLKLCREYNAQHGLESQNRLLTISMEQHYDQLDMEQLRQKKPRKRSAVCP